MKKLRIKFINIEEFTRISPSKTSKKPGLKKVLNGISEKTMNRPLDVSKISMTSKPQKELKAKWLPMKLLLK